jgi:hypothetical protein
MPSAFANFRLHKIGLNESFQVRVPVENAPAQLDPGGWLPEQPPAPDGRDAQSEPTRRFTLIKQLDYCFHGAIMESEN